VRADVTHECRRGCSYTEQASTAWVGVPVRALERIGVHLYLEEKVMANRQDVVDVLEHDHREVEGLFDEIERTTDASQRRELTDQVIIELVRHSVAEEQYLYPAARERIPDGDALVDREIADHNEVEEALKALEAMDAGDSEFMTRFRQMSNEVRAHVKEEEEELFPKLREHGTADELRELGEKVQMAKKLAPTRPHPSAPDTPPLNKILGPGVGLVDRARDKLTGRGQ
jgi:hemerythrin superfamily protein